MLARATILVLTPYVRCRAKLRWCPSLPDIFQVRDMKEDRLDADPKSRDDVGEAQCSVRQQGPYLMKQVTEAKASVRRTCRRPGAALVRLL